ncbi:fumarate hydratase, partial [Oceanidesulfovibrio marinus]
GGRKGYADGFLRKSSCDPMTRANSGDNTPAIIHFDVVPGDTLNISFLATGGGSENRSRVNMLDPYQCYQGLNYFILDRVDEAGPKPCPPLLFCFSIGGTVDNAAILTKKALLRELDDTHPDPETAAKEKELLQLVNDLGIGPMGLGGKTTCLAVKIAMAPVHIASLPLAVNIQCHSARHKEVT